MNLEKPTILTPDDSNEVFNLALQFVEETSQHLFLTGKAGTGKTTFLKYIKQHSKKHVLVAAPTGVAAINAGGVTIHSLFQLPFEPFIPNGRIKDAFKFGRVKISLLRQAELLIIDEVSMLRADVLDAIDTTLRVIRKNRNPFGGLQVLYIGDMFQLPPVVKDEEWNILREYYISPFFFHAKVLEQKPLVYIELKKIYRQREQTFIDLLNKVRNNILEPKDIELLNRQHKPLFRPSNKEKYIVLTTHNYQADNINAQRLKEIKEPIFEFNGEISGDFPEYALPTDMVLQLKKGAQIMFIKNDPKEEKRYYNGKLGEIVKIDKKDIWVRLADSDTEIKVEPETWKNIRYTLDKEKGDIEEEELGSFKQYPIRTAWAITIHKSQGLTFDRAIIDTGQAFAAGQAYVALSRCTSLEGIVLLSPINESCIQTNGLAIDFSKKEKPNEELKEQLTEAQKQFSTEQLLKHFNWEPFLLLLNEYRKLTEDKISDELQSAHEMSEMLYIKGLEQQGVAIKFQKQLERITQDGNEFAALQQIKERSEKAVVYFYESIRTEILEPLQLHIDNFQKIKKAKSYWKALCQLEEDIILFTKRLTNPYYNNRALLPDLQLAPLRKPSIFNQDEEQPKAKAQKGDSKKLSLQLFLEGNSIAEIAQKRNLAPSTIQGHLIEFIKTGKVKVEQIVPPEKVAAILPLVKDIIEENHTATKPIKEQLGDDYSYSEIKAVIYHWLASKS